MLIVLGIAGAMLVAQPGATAASPYAFYGFLVAVCAAARDLISRKVPAEIPTLVVALSVLVSVAIAGAIGMVVTQAVVVADLRDTSLLLLAGVLMVGGHVSIFYAFKYAPARTLAPFLYALTIWAVVLGYVFFGEVPNALAIAGMTLIALAGVMVVYVDGRRKTLNDGKAGPPNPQ